jgi:hypothetical protein
LFALDEVALFGSCFRAHELERALGVRARVHRLGFDRARIATELVREIFDSAHAALDRPDPLRHFGHPRGDLDDGSPSSQAPPLRGRNQSPINFELAHSARLAP